MCVPAPNKIKVTLVSMQLKMYLLKYLTSLSYSWDRYFLDSLQPWVNCSTPFTVTLDKSIESKNDFEFDLNQVKLS